MIYCTGEFQVCSDCISWLANADCSGLDYYYNAEESEQRFAEIVEGERAMISEYGSIHIGDEEELFSISPCDCCGTRLHGQRYSVTTWRDAE